MKRAADQFALPLDWPQAGDDSRFIVSDANCDAFEHFRAWSLWPVKATILTGPRRSGRTLLARAFVDRVHGRLFDRAERHNEAELFHAWNAAQDDGHPLVMIVDEVPPAWEIALPDLRTRLAITPIARIQQPDDQLFRSIVRLLFADRGLHVPEEALKYIAERVERSYLMAERVVGAIDQFAIAERARLTMPTVRRALAEGGIIEARGAA
jgi:chromosomal replication initiation ATPase DnaA